MALRILTGLTEETFSVSGAGLGRFGQASQDSPPCHRKTTMVLVVKESTFTPLSHIRHSPTS